MKMKTIIFYNNELNMNFPQSFLCQNIFFDKNNLLFFISNFI